MRLENAISLSVRASLFADSFTLANDSVRGLLNSWSDARLSFASHMWHKGLFSQFWHTFIVVFPCKSSHQDLLVWNKLRDSIGLLSVWYHIHPKYCDT